MESYGPLFLLSITHEKIKQKCLANISDLWYFINIYTNIKKNNTKFAHINLGLTIIWDSVLKNLFVT